ncbi:MAG: YcxB family protein [Clostridiales bacterium]|nr:YcxB family protein [Candidatus Crickella equi]
MARKKSNYLHPKYTLTQDDTIEFNRYYIQNTKKGRKVVWQQRMVFPAIFVGYVILALVMGFHSKPIYYLGGFILAMAVGYGLAAEKITLNRQEAEIKRSGYTLDEIHAEPTTLDFNDDGFDACYKGQEKDFTYEEVVKVTRTEKAIYIWLSDAMALQLPVRAFDSDEEKDRLYEYLAEKCVDAEMDDAVKGKLEKSNKK